MADDEFNAILGIEGSPRAHDASSPVSIRELLPRGASPRPSDFTSMPPPPASNESGYAALHPGFDPAMAYRAKELASETEREAQLSDLTADPRFSRREVASLLTALEHRDSTIERLSSTNTTERQRHRDNVADIRADAERRVKSVEDVKDSLEARVEAMQFMLKNGTTAKTAAANYTSRVEDARSSVNDNTTSFREMWEAKQKSFATKADTMITGVEALAAEAEQVVADENSTKRSNAHADDILRLALENHQMKLSLMRGRVQQQLNDDIGAQLEARFSFNSDRLPAFVVPTVEADVIRPVASELVESLTTDARHVLDTTRATTVEALQQNVGNAIEATVKEFVADAEAVNRTKREKSIVALCRSKELEYRRLLEALRATRDQFYSRSSREVELEKARTEGIEAELKSRKKRNADLRSLVDTLHRPASDPRGSTTQTKTAAARARASTMSKKRGDNFLVAAAVARAETIKATSPVGMEKLMGESGTPTGGSPPMVASTPPFPTATSPGSADTKTASEAAPKEDENQKPHRVPRPRMAPLRTPMGGPYKGPGEVRSAHRHPPKGAKKASVEEVPLEAYERLISTMQPGEQLIRTQNTKPLTSKSPSKPRTSSTRLTASSAMMGAPSMGGYSANEVVAMQELRRLRGGNYF